MSLRSRSIANSDSRSKARFASTRSATASSWTLTRLLESNETPGSAAHPCLPGFRRELPPEARRQGWAALPGMLPGMLGGTMKRITLCGLFIAAFIFAVALQSDARQEAGPAFDMTNAMI